MQTPDPTPTPTSCSTSSVRACQANDGATCDRYGCQSAKICELRPEVGHPRDVFPGVTWTLDVDVDHIGWTGELVGERTSIGFSDERGPGEKPWGACWTLAGHVDVSADTLQECLVLLRDGIAKHFAEGLITLIREQQRAALAWPAEWVRLEEDQDVGDTYAPGDVPPGRCSPTGNAAAVHIHEKGSRLHYAAEVLGPPHRKAADAALDAATLAWVASLLAVR